MKSTNDGSDLNNLLQTDGDHFIDGIIDQSFPTTYTNEAVVVTSTSMTASFSSINSESVALDFNNATNSTSRDNKAGDSTFRDKMDGPISRDNKMDDSTSQDNKTGDSTSQDNKTDDSTSRDNKTDDSTFLHNANHLSIDSALVNTSNVGAIDTTSNAVNNCNDVLVMNIDDINLLPSDAIMSDVSSGANTIPVNKISPDIAEASTSLYLSSRVEVTDNSLPRDNFTAVEENFSHTRNSENIVDDDAGADEIVPRKRSKIDNHVTTNVAATFTIDQQRLVSVENLTNVDRIDVNDTIMDDRDDLVDRVGDNDAIMNDRGDLVDMAGNNDTIMNDSGDLVDYRAATGRDISSSDVTRQNATDSNTTNDSDARDLESAPPVAANTIDDKRESITDRVESSFGLTENSVDFTPSRGSDSCQQLLANDNSVLRSSICINESATTREDGTNAADWQKYQEHGDNRCEAKFVDRDKLFERQENSTVNDDFEVEINKSDTANVGNDKCLRRGCTNMAVDNAEWEHEYCSNECVISHTKDIFEYWKRNYQAQLENNMKS